MNNKFPIKKYNKFLEYFRDYNQSLNDTVNNISTKDLLKIYGLIEIAIKSNSNIFICGNGGSSSVANHFLCTSKRSFA